MSEIATLYGGTLNASSWTMRAWLDLRAATVPFNEFNIELRKPQRYADLEAISHLSPAKSVPILDIGTRRIFESTAIMEFANEYCGGRLLPSCQWKRAEARSLIAWQHAGLSGICSRISFESAFYSHKRMLTCQEQKEAGIVIAHLENLLAASPGSYLFGDIGLADFMLVPTVVRLMSHRVDLDSNDKTKHWAELILQNDLVVEWLVKAKELPPIWFEEYLLPGEPVKLYADEASVL